MRFYGNRCLHYTTDNTSDTCRISFDFRVIPASLFRLNARPSTISSESGEDQRSVDVIPREYLNEDSPNLSKLYLDDESLKKLALRGAKPLLEGKYYLRMMIDGV